MEKVITISNKNFSMKSSALTQFSYKDFTGKNFLKDIKELTKLKGENFDIEKIDDLDIITKLILEISYVMIKEYDNKHNQSQVIDYNDFLSQIDNLYDSQDWIYQVIELACTPISGQLQINK